jgi:hypothetical protein
MHVTLTTRDPEEVQTFTYDGQPACAYKVTCLAPATEAIPMRVLPDGVCPACQSCADFYYRH